MSRPPGRPDAGRSCGRYALWVALESTARVEPVVAPGARKGAPVVAGMFVRRGPRDRTLGGCSEGQGGGESDTMQEKRAITVRRTPKCLPHASTARSLPVIINVPL